MSSQPWHFSQPGLADQNRMALVKIAYSLAQAWTKRLSDRHPEHSLITPLDQETRSLMGTLENQDLVSSGDDSPYPDYVIRLQWAVWSYLAHLAKTAQSHQALFELLAQASYEHGKEISKNFWIDRYSMRDTWDAVMRMDPFQWSLASHAWIEVGDEPLTVMWKSHPANSHLSIIKQTAVPLSNLCLPYYHGYFHGMRPDAFIEWNPKQNRLTLKLQ